MVLNLLRSSSVLFQKRKLLLVYLTGVSFKYKGVLNSLPFSLFSKAFELKKFESETIFTGFILPGVSFILLINLIKNFI